MTTLPQNLNQLTYHTNDRDVPFDDSWSRRRGKSFQEAEVRPVFRDIESALVEEIQKSTYVVGCVAWLTNPAILEALTQTSGCQFVVQAEDWLRPDSDDYSLAKQRRLIERLPPMTNYALPMIPNVCSQFDIDPLRISGVPKNATRNQPRMHHKFAIFGKRPVDPDRAYRVDFDTVFTGSFNWTQNATRSLENGVFIKSEEIVDAYVHEHFKVLSSSRKIRDEWWDAGAYGWNQLDDEYLRDGT